MSEGRKGPERKDDPPGGRPAGSSPEPRRGDLGSQISWAIVSANVLAVVALVLGAVALVLHLTEEGEEGGAAAVAKPTATVQATATPPIVVQGVSVDDDPSWGPEDAPVTIVEFSDFL